MKYTYYLILAITCFALGSCGNKEQDLSLNFRLEYNDAPLVIFEDYDYPSGSKIQFQRISFFLSDIIVSDEDNNREILEEVVYVDLTNSHLTSEAAAEGFELELGSTESSYDQISFNIGLTSDLNSKTPEEFFSSSPLSNSAEYWRSWESYIYYKIEGAFDMNGDGELGAGEAFQLHIGTDESMRSFSSDFSADNNTIVIDVDKIFNYDGNTYDLASNPRLHVLNDATLESMAFLASGIEQATTIE